MWQKEEPKNVEAVMERGLIVIRINPEERLGPSSTGKTTIVAKGSIEIDGITVSITAYTKK